jgi:hypothetical protein
MTQLAPGMMTDLQGNVVPIPKDAQQEPIQSAQPSDDNMMTDLQGNRVPIPKGSTQEALPQEGAASRFGSGVVAGTKAMIPSSATETAKSVLANAATGGVYSGVEAAKGIYEGYKQAREEGQPIYSSVASGIGSVAGLDPEGIRERAAKGDIAGIVGEAIPSIALTLAGGEHERIGRAFTSDARALKTASATREATTATYAQRLAEQETATDQAVRATQRAKQLTDSLGKDPNVTQQHVDDANSTASAAAANARKATQALNDAHEAHAQAGVEVDRLTRKSQRSAQKASEKTTKAVGEAKEDFQKAIPPAPSGKAAYSDRDYDVGRGYLEKHHTDVQQIGSVQDAYDAFDHIQKGMETEIAPYVQKYAKEPIATNVNMDVRDALKDNPRQDFVEKGMAELENYNLTDPTIEEADTIRKQLNDENRAILRKNMWDVDTALGVDPAFAARYAAADSLRNGIYNTFEDKGVTGIREMRQDERSIINLRNAAERQLVRGDVRVRGSGESGPIRKMLAKGASYVGGMAGAGVGAEIGGPLGASAGAEVGQLAGKKIGGLIAPGDLTRNELLARSMKVKGGGVPTTEIRGVGAPSGEFGPPEPVSPKMQLYTPQRELTPLHSELATHYGESIDSSYLDLEKRFKDDLADKKAHGVPLEPAEKTLLGKINQADAVDRLAAQKQMQETLTAGKKPAGPTLPDEVEPLLHPPQSKLAEGMDTQRGITHDLAHVVVGSERGINFADGIQSHLHPEVSSAGALMSAPIDWEPYIDDEGNVDPAKLKSKIADIAATYVAGGVANDLYHDIPFTENHHLGADVRILKSFIKNVGFTEAEASKMIAQAADDAAQVLSRPGVQDILEQHAAVREAGLDSKYHVSPERMDQILQDVKDANSTGKSTGAIPASNRPGEEAGAEAEAELEEGNPAELRPTRKGPTEGEGGGARGDEQVKPGAEAGTVKSENPQLALPNPRAASMKDEPVYKYNPDLFKSRYGTGQEWYHGTTADFTDFKHEGIKRGTTDWNSQLGTHFAADENVAHEFANGRYSGVTEGGKIIPAKLNIDNPKSYQFEGDMGDDALKSALKNGVVTLDQVKKVKPDFNPNQTYHEGNGIINALRGKRNEIATNFKADLKSQGHDGIVYGNVVEGGFGNPAAIAFEPNQIERTDIKPEEPKLGTGTPKLTHKVTETGGEVRLDTDKGNEGMLKYALKGDEASVTGVRADEPGKGIGTAMYERAAQEVKARGAKSMTSDLGGQTSMDAAKVWDRLSKAHPGEIEKIDSKPGSPGYRWTFPEEVKPANPQLSVPPERTTGNLEHDRIIKEGGGIPGGVFKGDAKIGVPELAMFHDPQSGTTLALKTDEGITPEKVRERLEESRAQYAAANAKKAVAKLDQAIKPESPELSGKKVRGAAVSPQTKAQILAKDVTVPTFARDNAYQSFPKGAGAIDEGDKNFLLADGSLIHAASDQEHDAMIDDIGAKRLHDAGAIRMTSNGLEIFQKPTDDQLQEIGRFAKQNWGGHFFWDFASRDNKNFYGNHQGDGEGSIGDFRRAIDNQYPLTMTTPQPEKFASVGGKFVGNTPKPEHAGIAALESK